MRGLKLLQASVFCVLAACGGSRGEPISESTPAWREAFDEVQAMVETKQGVTALITKTQGATIHVTDASSPLFGMSFVAEPLSPYEEVEVAVLGARPCTEVEQGVPPDVPDNLLIVGTPVLVRVLSLPDKKPFWPKDPVQVSLPIPSTSDDDAALWTTAKLVQSFLGRAWVRDEPDETDETARSVSREVRSEPISAGVKDRAFFCEDDYQINCLPVYTPVTFTTQRDVPIVEQSLSITDEDDDVLTVMVRLPRHGSATLLSSGIFSYTPDAGFTGNDSFDFYATDGEATISATVSIIVQ